MNDISIVRGDTLRLCIVSIKTADGADYILSDSDIIYMDIKKADCSGRTVIRKTVSAADYSDGILIVTLLPAETAGIPIGDYLFDMRLFADKENIFTIVPASRLTVRKNITDIPQEV